MHWLLMELLVVESIDGDTYFSGLLHMESVSNKGEVRVNESHELRDALLDGASGVEQHFDPSIFGQRRCVLTRPCLEV